MNFTMPKPMKIHVAMAHSQPICFWLPNSATRHQMGEEEISTCEGCCKDVFLNKWSTRNRLQDIPNFLNLNKIEDKNFNLKLDRLFIF
jgi:hypothetical protein